MRTKAESNVRGVDLSVLSVRAAGLAACGVVCLLLLAAASPAEAGTIYVNGATGNDAWDGLCEEWDGGTCGPKATIQAGIDAAVDGDEVVVADGTYTGDGNKNLDFGGKPITVRSASGDAESCVIDCEGDGRGFYFHSGEGADSVVEGLAITDGSVDGDSVGNRLGGGVHCYESDPTLSNCVIRGCSNPDYGSHGGGVYCYGSSPDLSNCTISDNRSYAGGGIFCEFYSNPTLTNCAISGNRVHNDGGGVHCEWSDPTLINCTIGENRANDGGGLYCYCSDPSMASCRITRNTASRYGGGVHCESSSPTLTNCKIKGNVATGSSYGGGWGGGVQCWRSSSPTLIRCTIAGNTALNGGGVHCWECSNPALMNCAISGNTSRYGGGVFCNRADPTLMNCTINGNEASDAGGGVRCYSDSDPTLTNCIVWYNVPQAIDVNDGEPLAVYSNIEAGTGEPWFGEGCLDVNPLITVDGHLTLDSPCIDMGDPEGDYLGQVDWDGETRVSGDFVDMGIDEWLDSDTDGLPDWWEELCFGDPVAADPQGDEDDDGRVNLVEYESGTDPTVPPLTYYVDLEGDDAWDGLSPEWDGTHGPKATIQAGIDACHPREGDEVVIADGTYAGPGNRDLDFGGRAIVVRGVSGDPASCVIDCGGSVDDPHRGFYFHGAEQAGSVVDGVTITSGYVTDEHVGGDDGGAVLCIGNSSPTITKCILRGNRAESGGGGLYCQYYCDVALKSCTITGNEANDGGGVCCEDSSPTLTNCTILHNTANDGGGVYCDGGSATLTNCIVWNNVVAAIDGPFPGVLVRYSNIDGGTEEPWFGEGCIDIDPLFVDPDGPDNDPETWEDNDYRLQAGSPCVDAGDPLFEVEPGETDLDGHVRVWDGDGDDLWVVDMGAYEFGSYPLGDCNCDGAVTFDDVQPFIRALDGEATYYSYYPDCRWENADVDGDGAVTFDDIQPFVGLFE